MNNISSETVNELKTSKRPIRNITLLDYIIGIQLDKIEKNKSDNPEGYLSEGTEAAMANLIELLVIRQDYNLN